MSLLHICLIIFDYAGILNCIDNVDLINLITALVEKIDIVNIVIHIVDISPVNIGRHNQITRSFYCIVITGLAQRLAVDVVVICGIVIEYKLVLLHVVPYGICFDFGIGSRCLTTATDSERTKCHGKRHSTGNKSPRVSHLQLLLQDHSTQEKYLHIIYSTSLLSEWIQSSQNIKPPYSFRKP